MTRRSPNVLGWKSIPKDDRGRRRTKGKQQLIVKERGTSKVENQVPGKGPPVGVRGKIATEKKKKKRMTNVLGKNMCRADLLQSGKKKEIKNSKKKRAVRIPVGWSQSKKREAGFFLLRCK